MTILNIILIAILAFGLIRGFVRGFVKQVASVAGFILGIAAAYLFAGTLAVKLSSLTDIPNAAVLAFSYILIFAIVAVICVFLGKLANNFISLIQLGGLNRICGAVVGFLKYVVIMGLLINFYHSYDENGNLISKETREKSSLYHILQQTGEKLLPYVEEFKDMYHAR